MLDQNCTWSDDEIDEAIRRAQGIEAFDPDAAQLLYAQANEAKKNLYGEDSESGHGAYDPIALYARILRFYKGAISEERLDRMDYRRFFGYVREAELIAIEENEASKSNRTNQDDAYSAIGALPHAQEYTGEVINLI